MEKPKWHEIEWGKSYVLSGRRLKDLLRRSTDVHGTQNQIHVVEDADGGVSVEFASPLYCYIVVNGSVVPAIIPITLLKE
jgi:hypothetical protein